MHLCSTTTSKLNVLVTKLHEFLAHASVEDSGQTPTSKDTEGTADETGDKTRVNMFADLKHMNLFDLFRSDKQASGRTLYRSCCVTGKLTFELCC